MSAAFVPFSQPPDPDWPQGLLIGPGMHERVARILEATPDYVAICTLDGKLTYLNRAGREALGLGFDAPLNGRNLSEIHPAWAFEIVHQEGIAEAIRHGVWRGETALLLRDGGELPVSQIILSHMGPAGEVEFISTSMRDISERKRQEVARIEWANRYDAAIRASGQLLFDWDSLTNDITWGANTEQILGYSPNQLAGGLYRFRELIHRDDLSAFDEEIQRVLLTRDPFFLEFRVRRREGSTIDIQAKGYFFLDREGRLSRMIGFLADITAQRRQQQELALVHDQLEARVAERTAELARANVVIQERARQQEAVAYLGQRALSGVDAWELIDEGVSLLRSVLGVDYCIVLEREADSEYLRPRAMSGFPPEAAVERLPGGCASQPGYALMVGEPVIVEDMATESRFRVCEPLLRLGVRSGATVQIAAGDQPIGTLAAFSRQLRKFTKEDVNFLQSIANVLTATISRQRAEESIRQAHEQAEEANRAKSEFLSRMSHELRTPLNAILGFTQLLEMDQPTASQEESIVHISRAGRHLLLLINEVLDIARIESGRLALTPETIEMTDFLRASVDLIRPLAQRHDVRLSLDVTAAGTHVVADRQRLKQVMLNLLSNAVKYNRPGGSVTVHCTPVAGSRLRIHVTDTGQGIAANKMSRLFVPFERLGAEATDTEGTGIGLALSRGIVHALHGEIGAESVAGEGSTFWIEFPAELAAPAPAAPPAPATPTAQQCTALRTLLYIEDQDLNLRLVERILLQHPQYKLVSAMQGQIGIDLAREHRPDAILLDLNLPDMPGDEVLARLKADPDISDIPVIMVSADAMGDRIETLLAAGASAYLTKPYKVAEFLRVIRETLAAK